MNQAIDVDLWRSQSVGQRTRPRRCSKDMARRRWYAMHRTARLANLGTKKSG